MPSGISIADLFASLDLDSSGFDAKLQSAKVGLVTAANDMALPVGKLEELLKNLSKQVGPTAAIEGMKQLTVSGNTAYEAVRKLVGGIESLKAAEKDAASAAKQWAADRDAAGREDSAREDHRLAQAKAVASEIQRFENDLVSANKAQVQSRIAAEKELNDSVTAFYKQQTDAAKASADARQASITNMRTQGAALTQVGLGIIAAFAPIDAVILGSAKAFADFDAELTHSLSIMGNVSAMLRDQLSAAAIDLSSKYAFSAKEIAKSIYDIGSAGYSAEQTLSVLPTVTKFAAAAFTDLDTATKLLTSSQSALGMRSEDTAVNLANLTHIGDVLVKADTLAAGTSKQFAEALYNVGSTARQLKVPLETTVAALAVFARQGITGAEAGTQLGIVLRDMSTKAITNAEAWKKMNVAVYDSQGNFNNLGDIIGQLEAHFKGLSAEQVRMDLQQLGLAQRSMRFTLTMLGMGDSLDKFKESLIGAGGTMEEIANKNLQTFNKQAELLKNNITNLAIEVGGPLIGELNKLIESGGPLSALIKDMAAGFHDLSPEIKSTIAQLTLVAAAGGTAAGGLLVVGGQVLRVAADLKTLGVSMTAITELLGVGSGAAAAGLIGLIGISLVGALVAATKQWNNYKEGLDAAYQKQKAFYDLKPKIPTPNGGTSSQDSGPFVADKPFSASDGAAAMQHYKELGITIVGVKDAVTGLAVTTKAYTAEQQAALLEAQKSFNAAKYNLEELDKKFAVVKQAYKDGEITQAEYQANLVGYQKQRKAALSEEVSAQKAASKAFVDAQKEANDETRKGVEAQKRYREELAFFGVEVRENKIAEWTKKIGDLTMGVITGKVSLESYNKAVAEFNRRVTEIDIEKIAKDAAALDIVIGKANTKQMWEDMKNGTGAAGATMKMLTDATLKQFAAMMPLRKETKEMTDAFHLLGLKSTVELNEFAEKAVKAYDLIRQSGVATPQSIAQAWVKAAEAQMDAGQKFSLTQMFIIAEVEEANKNASKRIMDIAKDTSREITRLSRDMAKTLVDSLIGLFDNSANKELDKQIKDLTADMEAHTAAFQKVQADAAAAIIQINDDLAKSIADITAKGQEALSKETEAYNKFVRDTQSKMASVVTTHQKAMGQEVQAVQDGLRKATEAYDDFVQDAARSLQRLQQAHVETQRQIRDDAEKSLRDQTKDYQRFVEDTNDEIRKAQLAGDSEQVAELQKNLQRRKEDYDTFRADLAQKTAEDIAADQKRQAQEVEDLQKQLADKKKALDEAQAQAAEQIADITRKHAEAQAQELKDLRDSLVERTKAFEEFKKQNAEDTAAQIKAAQDKAAADLKAVQDNLTAQTEAYEAFKKDYLAKLAELEAAHKSVFDRIGEMFENMLKGFAEGLGKFVAGEVFNALLDKIRGKLFKAFDLGGVIPGTSPSSPVNLPSDIPPGGNVDVDNLPGGGNTGSSPSTGGGGAGGFAGAMDIVGAIGSVATAISSIVGNFQMSHMNKLLGLIEISTRGLLNMAISHQETFNTYLPGINHLVDIWGAILDGNQILRDIAARVGGGGGGDNPGGPSPQTTGSTTADLIQQILNSTRDAANDQNTLNDIVRQNNQSSLATEAYNRSITQSADSVDSNSTAVYGLTQVIQGALPQGPSSTLPDGRIQPDIYGVTSNSPGAMQTDQLVLGSDIARERNRQIQNLAPVAPAGAYMQGDRSMFGNPGTTGYGNGGFASANGEGRTGFDSLSNTFQYTDYARPMGPQGPGTNLNVTINVPNPDGDLVAANFIDSVEKRGVRLR